MESLPQATEQQLFAMCQLALASQIWWTSSAFTSTGPGVMVVIQLYSNSALFLQSTQLTKLFLPDNLGTALVVCDMCFLVYQGLK